MNRLRLAALVAFAALAASACVVQDDDPDVVVSPTPSPSPVVIPPPDVTPANFSVLGTVTAASSTSAGPSPAASPTEAPGVSGTLDVKVASFTQSEVLCEVNEGEVLVVNFTKDTIIDPARTVDDDDYPNSLRGKRVEASGSILREADGSCKFDASRLDFNPSPSGTGRSSPRPADTSPGTTS